VSPTPQRSAAKVGSWNKAYMMGISVGMVWDSHEQNCPSYFEENINGLIEHLPKVDVVVGYNVIGFYYPLADALLQNLSRETFPP
jgi:DEAD/DEAH box helicase domain-containing protein